MNLAEHGMEFLCEECGIEPIGDYNMEYMRARDIPELLKKSISQFRKGKLIRKVDNRDRII